MTPLHRLQEKRRPRWRFLLLTAACGATLYISWHSHIAAGQWFPVPWRDEAVFGWQGIAMAEGRGLFTPQLNPERTIWWMPPGYFLVMGGVYRAFGFAVEHMRWASWCFITLWSAILLTWTHRRFRRFEISLLVLWFSLNSFCVVAGNMGRMEALLSLVTLCGYWLMDGRHGGVGLALLIVSPLIHPAGVVFAGFGFLAFWYNHAKGFRFGNYGWWNWGAVVLAAVAWMCFIAAFVPHMADFIADMGHQFAAHHGMLTDDPARIVSENPLWLFLRSLLLQKYSLIVTAYIVLGGWLFRQGDKTDAYLWGYGLSGILVRMAGAEMWYTAYAAAGIFIWFVLAGKSATIRIDRTRWADGWRWTARGAIFSGVAALLFVANLLPNPIGYPQGIRWWGWTLKTRGDYLTRKDADTVAAELQRVMPGLNAATRIRHIPAADGLLFYQLQPALGTAHYPVFSASEAPYDLVHLYPEPYMSDLSELPVGIESWPNARKLHQREAHAWFLVKRAGAHNTHDAQ